MELDWIAETVGQAAADALVANRARLVEAEVAEFVLAAHWADLHDEATVARGEGSGRALPGTERAKRLGGDGTPLVAEFAAAELGCLTGRGSVAASTLMADALDVRHRHPLLWAAVTAGEIAVWQARKVAARTRSLSLSWEQVLWVDAQVASYAQSLPWVRFWELLEAKVVEADPAAAQARADAAAMERFVATGQCNEYGLKTVIAKAQAGDAVFFVAMCDRIAQCLARDGDSDPVGARRSKALGILADPVRALELLLAHAGDPEDAGGLEDAEHEGADTDAAEDAVVSAGDVSPWQDDSDDAAEAGTGGRLAGVLGDPAGFVTALGSVDPGRLRPAVTLYVHVSRESLDAARAGVACGVGRLEGVGPVTVGQVQEFLGHANVTVRPVVDLAENQPVDGYEVPDRMAEALHLRTPAGVFPFSSNRSRRKDRDHTRRYVPPARGGPPGQTRVGNLGPMGRYAHRVKTHGRGWRHHQPVPGVFLWRTPHGYWFRTDATGTHRLGKYPSRWEHAGLGALQARLGDTDSVLEQHYAGLIARAG